MPLKISAFDYSLLSARLAPSVNTLFQHFIVHRQTLSENACKEHGLPAKYYGADMMFQFWEHKKRILREEYHMVWRSDGDLHPDRLY